MLASHCTFSNAKINSSDTNTFYNDGNNCNSDRKSSMIDLVIAPHVIKKSYGKGNIVYLGDADHLDTQGKSLINSHLTIDDIVNILGLHIGSEEKNDSKPSPSSRESKDPTRIRGDVSKTRLIDSMRISPGHTTLINSTSFLLPHSSYYAEDPSINSSYNLAFRRMIISDYANIVGSGDRMTTNIPEAIDDSKGSPEVINHNNKSSLMFKDAIIKDLKLYGTYEAIVNSSETRRAISLPAPSSYNDYIEFTIPTGFSLTLNLSESEPAYAEFDILANNQSSFETLKIYGGKNISSPEFQGEGDTANSSSIVGSMIELRNLKTDATGFTSISFLMKSPNIRITNGVDGNDNSQQDIALIFKKNSPQGDRVEIGNLDGFTDTRANISYVDNYNQGHRNGIRTQFVTYLEDDVQVIKGKNSRGDNQNATVVNVQLPGSISETAKQAGINTLWRKTFSTEIIALGAFIAIIATVSIKILWARADRINL